MSLETLLQVSVGLSFGTLVTLVVFIFRIGMFVSDTKHGISDAKETSVRAHHRIDRLEERI